jgi:hypothetical protein
MEDDPLTLRQGLKNMNFHKLAKAMDEEIKSMYDNKVWNIVPLPKCVKSISCKWIFKTKKDSEGNMKRYKYDLLLRNLHRRKVLTLRKLSRLYERKILLELL